MPRSLLPDVLHDILPAATVYPISPKATLCLICPQGPWLFCKLLILWPSVPDADTMAEFILECQVLGVDSDPHIPKLSRAEKLPGNM